MRIQFVVSIILLGMLSEGLHVQQLKFQTAGWHGSGLLADPVIPLLTTVTSQPLIALNLLLCLQCYGFEPKLLFILQLQFVLYMCC